MWHSVNTNKILLNFQKAGSVHILAEITWFNCLRFVLQFNEVRGDAFLLNTYASAAPGTTGALLRALFVCLYLIICKEICWDDQNANWLSLKGSVEGF